MITHHQIPSQTLLPYGFSFEEPSFTRLRRKLSQDIRHTLEKAGFSEIVPPLCDFSDTFAAVKNQGVDDPSFDFYSKQGEPISLRTDITVQVLKYALYLTQNTDSLQYYYYIQPVFSDSLEGRRQKIQIGVELISKSINGQNENITYILNLARNLLKDFDIRIIYGDMHLVKTLLQGLPYFLQKDFIIALHHKDEHSLALLLQDAKKYGLKTKTGNILMELPFQVGDQQVLVHMRKLLKGYPRLHKHLLDAEKMENVIYDFSLMRPFSYYDGPVFSGFIENSEEAIVSGGSYSTQGAIDFVNMPVYSSSRQNRLCTQVADLRAMGFSINFSLWIERALTVQ